MSQNDFTIANQGFPAFRADLNSALQALASNSSGTSAPSTTFANMWWYDSSNNIMYIRNEDNDAWIKFAELDQTNDKFVLSGTLQLDDGTVSAPALTFNSDTNMGIYRGGTDILKFVTAGVDAIEIDASQGVTLSSYIQIPDYIYHVGDGNTYFGFPGGDQFELFTAGQSRIKLVGSETVFNESSVDKDFRVESNGGSHALFVEGSSGNVGIGTSSPASLFGSGTTVEINGSGGAALRLARPSYANGDLYADENGLTIRTQNNYQMRFLTNNTLAATIDTSQNLLVGVTSTSIPGVGNTTEGVSLRGSTGSASSIVASRATASAGYFNINADGDILSLRRSGTQIGSIGVNTKLYIGGSGETHTTGVSFQGSGTSTNRNISPSDGSGALVDGAVNLGSSSARWNSLWLSGGVYLGGTGSANHLQDYETGTWTPVFLPASGSFSSVSYSSFRFGRYVRIGDTVIAHGFIRTDSISVGTATGAVWIDNLPFTLTAGVPYRGQVSITRNTHIGSSPYTELYGGNIADATDHFIVYKDLSGGALQVSDLATGTNSNQIGFVVTYEI